MPTIRLCTTSDLAAIYAIVNDGAQAYRGVIAADRWKEPYMPLEELREEIAAGVMFSGCEADGQLVAVMGLQHVQDVSLIRHAYTRTAYQGKGYGVALLEHLRAETGCPMLVGTWTAATWAVSFYQRRGFRLVTPEEKEMLLRRYWTIPERQIEESVVLADAKWTAGARA
jgi:GNAT superfamily N-acetyltransferase